MGYKTILVHLNNEQRVARLIGAATRLALPSNAHLIGLFVVPHSPYGSPIFPKTASALIQSGVAAYRKSGEQVHQAFEQATANLPLVAEWRLYDAKGPGYADAVLDHARAADLVIAAQTDFDWEHADQLDIPDWLAMASGRPVLVVPKTDGMKTIGERVLVAWNNSRESARAVFDALPLLEAAKEVRIITVSEAGGDAVPSGEICATLARRGVNCIADDIVAAKHTDPGEQLLAQVAKTNSDLLVMGCYGRSRFREFVLGGASRHVLHNTTVPVLMSH